MTQVPPSDKRRFLECYATVRRQLFGLALYYCNGHRAEAEEAFQDACVRLYRALTDNHTPSHARALALRALRTACIDRARRRAAETRAVNDWVYRRSSAHSSPAFDARELQDALQTLDADDREIVVMHYFAELSFDEIGETVGLAKNTVMKRCHDALAKLAARLKG